MIEVFVLAIALSMDSFAIAVGLGANHKNKTLALGLTVGLYFGFFQGLMPLIGYFVGKSVFDWIEVFAHWIAFALLVFVGGKMVYESLHTGTKKDIADITHKVLILLAIATSIDAMAAGFLFALLDVNALLACFFIGFITFVCSFLGVLVGKKGGAYLESKAELLGGVVLISIGFKILFF